MLNPGQLPRTRSTAKAPIRRGERYAFARSLAYPKGCPAFNHPTLNSAIEASAPTHDPARPPFFPSCAAFGRPYFSRRKTKTHASPNKLLHPSTKATTHSLSWFLSGRTANYPPCRSRLSRTSPSRSVPSDTQPNAQKHTPNRRPAY